MWPIGDDVVRDYGKNYAVVLDKMSQQWEAKLTDKERQEIGNYTASGYISINSYLRGEMGAGNEHYNSKVKQIDSAINKATTPPPPELVWRGVNYYSAASMNAGDVVTLKGFQSTSARPTFAHDWGTTLFEIKPAKGAYVKAASSHPHEAEYLLPHGAQYRVRGRTTIKIKNMHSYGESKPREATVIQLEMLK